MNRPARVAAGILVTCASAAVTVPAPAAGAATEPITLTFESRAFQEPAVAAVEQIVTAWNEANPSIEVQLRQGSWNSFHDDLVTQFAGGTPPDIIHGEAAEVRSYAEQGHLADLAPHLSEELLTGVNTELWGTVTSSDGSIFAAPTLLQSYVVFASVDAFEAEGVAMPVGETLPWGDFEALAARLTTAERFGVGWGLRNPTATVMNLALGFGGSFFSGGDDTVTFAVGDAELAVPKRIHDLAHETGALDPVSLTLSTADAAPGFYGGDYAMFVGGSYVAQQLVAGADDDFRWTVLPPLAGPAGANQAANPQTLSVASQSEHVEEAAAFINFFMSPDNLSAFAVGDWLIPSSAAARQAALEATGGENGWDVVLATGELLVTAPFQSIEQYPRWRDLYATPALQEYFIDGIDLEDLRSRLTSGWERVADG